MSKDTVAQVRAEVADALSSRLTQDESAGRARMSVSDQRAFARSVITKVFDQRARAAMTNGDVVLSVEEEERIEQSVFDSLFGLGRLQRLLDDPDIENINANGCDVVWVRYADGRREQVGSIADSDEQLIELIRTAAARFGPSERRFDLGAPRLNLQLPDGSRLFAVMAVTGRPSLSIRRHRYLKVGLDELVSMGTMSEIAAEFLAAAVKARLNIVVCGGTGAGKTTLLRALASEIPHYERLITIEDSLELGLDRYVELHGDVVAMEAREANVEGEGEVSLAELVRWALRMSPDRVVVGEVRGNELLPMLNAMSQGNDGSMCTLHANSSAGAFSKLAAYAIQSQERLPLEATNLLVANAVDLVVFLGHDAEGHGRYLSSIREVTGADGAMVISNEIFAPGPEGRALPASPITQETRDQLGRVGFDARSLEQYRWAS
jgi:pilus assembly protein CpaF